jgi:hypothetical protein
LNQSIQHHIDVYLSKATFAAVQNSFPYLVSKEFASGGGDVCISLTIEFTHANSPSQVPEFQWHVIDDQVPFQIQDTGIYVTPFAGKRLS